MPIERKIDTVQAFLKAFHDENSIEIATYSICYVQKRPQDLEKTNWKKAVPKEIRTTISGILGYQRCFPEGDGEVRVPICLSYQAAFDLGKVLEVCIESTMLIGCEYRYPDVLRDITPLEEKLISLNTMYGVITKFNIRRGQLTGPTYRKYVAGHITVFPNKIETLATIILPHPLIKALD